MPGSHAFCIHGNDLVVYIGNILLAFLYYLGLKGRFPVLWHIDFHGAITAVHALFLVAVAMIIAVGTLPLHYKSICHIAICCLCIFPVYICTRQNQRKTCVVGYPQSTATSKTRCRISSRYVTSPFS